MFLLTFLNSYHLSVSKGSQMNKGHLVFVRDILKETISRGDSSFADYKLLGLLEVIKSEIELCSDAKDLTGKTFRAVGEW